MDTFQIHTRTRKSLARGQTNSNESYPSCLYLEETSNENIVFAGASTSRDWTILNQQQIYLSGDIQLSEILCIQLLRQKQS